MKRERKFPPGISGLCLCLWGIGLALLGGCGGAQARMRLVKAAGFDFTAEEMDAMKRELTDRELEWVTGGVFHQRLKNKEVQKCGDPFAR